MPFLPSSLLRKDKKKKQGLSETLIVHCLKCRNNVHSFGTSENVQTEKGNKMKDINLRSVAATTLMGLTKLRRLCNDLNLSQPVNEKPYNNYLSYLKTCAVTNCGRSIGAAAHELRKLKLEGKEDVGQVLDVAVSVHAAWQKTYGFNSLNGVIFVISVDTGCVLEYVVKTKHCQECKSNRNAIEEWIKKHKKTCCINHVGSSGAMEEDRAVEMFLNSIDMHNLKYTTYVGDGDSSSSVVYQRH